MKQPLPFNLKLALLVSGIVVLIPTVTQGQICGPAYSVQSQTVMEEQIEQRLRVVYDDVYEDRDVVTQKLVPKTRMEKRTHTVSKPVVETSTVEERYTVLKPVTRREWVDQSYDETTYVTETAEREETHTSYRPVTETQYQTQNYIVQRPVTETQYQTQQHLTYKPVTTYQTAVVDQGGYVAQQFYQPGDTRYGLRFLPGGYSAGPYGAAYRRGGLGWVPYTSQGNTYAQLQYQPNPVAVAVPQTTLMPEVQQTQVPVQVTRMQQEVVQQQIPVNITRMQPVQEVRKVPYAVQKPVTRHIDRKVPVDRVEWVEQEMVRPKTIERTSYKLETVEQEVPVQYYETQAVTTKVRVKRQVPRYEAYEVRRLVPRTVQSPVILSYSDPYSVPLSLGHSSWMPAISSPSTASETIRYGEPREAGADTSGTPRSSLKVEMVEPQVEDLPEGAEADDEKGLELTPSANDDGPKA
ncbi:MAG: hypothetical protein R3C53_18165 [Pirellulaceae bacterium]